MEEEMGCGIERRFDYLTEEIRRNVLDGGDE